MWVAQTSDGEYEGETIKDIIEPLLEGAIEDEWGIPEIISLTLDAGKLSEAAQKKVLPAINATLENRYYEALVDIGLEEQYIKEIREYN